MFDYHMHTTVSFDGEGNCPEMAAAAKAAGLREICFTDHMDHHFAPMDDHDLFTMEAYSAAYDGLELPGLLIRRGIETGLTLWNRAEMERLLAQRPFDFVIGSVHYVDGYDPYDPQYWEGKTLQAAFRRYLEHTLDCVRLHENFDVLGHLNYVAKSAHNPSHQPLEYRDYQEITDEILRVLVQKGKGMEINSSGVDRCGDFLPGAAFLRRFRELGGEIVTMGSDAHGPGRVGQYAPEAMEILRDIFGYVCTFAERKVIFHKL